MPMSSRAKKDGFTVIEMLVAISIYTSLTVFVMASYREVDDRLSLRAAANQLAADIRRAQSLGAGSLTKDASELMTAGGISYGVFFDPTRKNEYSFFKDISKDRMYTSAAGELIQTRSMKRGYSIKSMKGTLEAPPNATVFFTAPLQVVNISFRRPQIEANILVNGVRYQNAVFELESPRGATRRVEITTTGLITTQ